MGVSLRVVEWLRQQGYDAKHLREENLHKLPDRDIFKRANEEDRVILTFDLDFGEIFYFLEKRKAGIIVMRFDDQRIEKVNQILEKFIKYYKLNPKSTKFSKSLVILGEDSVRIING